MMGQVYCLQSSSRGACDRENHSLIWLEREKETSERLRSIVIYKGAFPSD